METRPKYKAIPLSYEVSGETNPCPDPHQRDFEAALRVRPRGLEEVRDTSGRFL